jgi:hypothetical protein
VLSIVYVSSAVSPFTDEALAELLAQSRVNNSAAGLTGMLLYRDGQFMQALEGDDTTVRALYEIVAADPRHEGVRTLLEEQIDERRFPEWSMGFRALTESGIREIPGYSAFFQERSNPADWGTPSRSRMLLEWFRYHNAA